MKTIIAGSRPSVIDNNIDYLLLKRVINASGFSITEVVSGCAKGVDQLGERWALDSNLPIKRFPADWEHLGKRAGVLRNAEMAKYADALIYIWDGQSRGTQHMIDCARRAGLKVYGHQPPPAGQATLAL